MDDDNTYLAELSGQPRPDNLPDNEPDTHPARPAELHVVQKATPPPQLDKMKRADLLADIQTRWDADPDNPVFEKLKRRDVNRYKKAEMVSLLERLHAAGVGEGPALPSEFGDADEFDAAALNPDALDSLGEAMATFNRITVEVVEKASQVWQPGGYVLEGTGDYLGRPDVHTAMKGVMKEIALEAGPSDPIVQLVSSPWARYGLIMSAAMGSTAKKVTAAPPL